MYGLHLHTSNRTQNGLRIISGRIFSKMNILFLIDETSSGLHIESYIRQEKYEDDVRV